MSATSTTPQNPPLNLAPAAPSSLGARIGSGVNDLWVSFFNSLTNNVFILIGTMVTAVLAPYVLNWAKTKFDQSQRQLTLTTTLMNFVEHAKSMDRGDTAKMELFSKFLADNKAVFDLEMAGFDEKLVALHQEIAAEDTHEKLIQELTAEKAALIKQHQDAEAKVAQIEGLRVQAEQKHAADQAQISNLDNQLKAATTDTEKAALKEQLAKKQAEAEEQEKKITHLGQELEKARLAKPSENPSPVDEESFKLLEAAKNLPAKDRELAKAREQIEELKARVEQLYGFITNVSEGTWIYLGWVDDSGHLQEATLDHGKEKTPTAGKLYAVVRAVNIRNIPSGQDKLSYVLSIIPEGHRVELSDVRKGFGAEGVKPKGQTLWGKLKTVKNPPRFAFSKWLN